MIINGCWIKRLIWPVRYSMSAWKRNIFPSPNCKGWKGESAIHTSRGSSGFSGSWPCKTCMVISVKSRKILTCIDLHHTASLDGGLDGCSSILKAPYSQSAPKIFGKKYCFKGQLVELLSEHFLWKAIMCKFAPFDCMTATSVISAHETSASFLQFQLIMSSCHLRLGVVLKKKKI